MQYNLIMLPKHTHTHTQKGCILGQKCWGNFTFSISSSVLFEFLNELEFCNVSHDLKMAFESLRLYLEVHFSHFYVCTHQGQIRVWMNPKCIMLIN